MKKEILTAKPAYGLIFAFSMPINATSLPAFGLPKF
jgi:hypothetical protein